MYYDLENIFGNEIVVDVQPRIVDRQYAGYPGGNGLTAMWLGTRGYPIIIRGTLASYGPNYNTGRNNLQSLIDWLETLLWEKENDYKFKNTYFQHVVFERFVIIPDATGKTFHWTSEGYVTCQFVYHARALV